MREWEESRIIYGFLVEEDVWWCRLVNKRTFRIASVQVKDNSMVGLVLFNGLHKNRAQKLATKLEIKLC